MSDEASGKWLPYNSDGSVHDCRNQNKNGQVSKKQEAPLSMEDRLKRLESIVLGGGSR